MFYFLPVPRVNLAREHTNNLLEIVLLLFVLVFFFVFIPQQQTHTHLDIQSVFRHKNFHFPQIITQVCSHFVFIAAEEALKEYLANAAFHLVICGDIFQGKIR